MVHPVGFRMTRLLPLLAVILPLAACDGDETLRNYGAADVVWTLTELNGAPFTANSALSFLPGNRVTGTGPCNTFMASMSVPYPWFDLESLASTRRVCPHLADETEYFDALSHASQVEILGNVMVLSNPEGLSLVFKAVE